MKHQQTLVFYQKSPLNHSPNANLAEIFQKTKRPGQIQAFKNKTLAQHQAVWRSSLSPSVKLAWNDSRSNIRSA